MKRYFSHGRVVLLSLSTLFLLILHFYTGVLYAQTISLQQDLRFENFIYQKKLPPAFVSNSLVDSKGYLWVCSDALYRFDGVNTTKYSSYELNNRGLKNNYCDDLLNDPYGRLWIGNLAGLCYYDSFKDSIIYINDSPGRPIKYAFSFIIFDNVLWFVCNYGLCQLDLKTLTIKTTSLTEVKDPIGAYRIAENKLGISSRYAFYIYDTKAGNYTKMNFELNKTRLRINDIIEKGGQFYVATNAGLMMTNDFSELEPVRGLPPLYSNSLIFHPADKEQVFLWIATGGDGLYIMNTQTNQIQFHYNHQALAPFSIPSDNTFRLTADEEENIWISTEKGVSLLQLNSQHYQTKFLSFKNNSTDNLIVQLVRDKFKPDLVWLACQNQGLVLVNWNNKEIIQQHTSMEGAGAGLSITDLLQVDENNWLLLYAHSIAIWNKKKGIEKMAAWPSANSMSDLHTFTKLIQQNKDEFYITSTQGLFKYDLPGNQLRRVLHRTDQSAAPSPLDQQSGFFDDHDNLWMASRAGLVQYNTSNGKYDVYTQPDNDNGHSNFLNDVAAVDQQTIYCAGFGISRFDMVSKKFSAVNLAGLLKPNCLSLLADSSTLWANTNAGLLMIKWRTGETRQFIITVPYESYSFSRISKVNNDLLIGYRDAYTYLNLASIKKDKLPKSPVIETVFVNNEFYNLGISRHSFRHWQNNIRVVFTAFEYADASSIRFRYKLAGQEDQWNYTNNERSIQYARLSPGHYSLLIQAGNNTGWNQNAKEFSFVIRPAFWQTWWFSIAIFILLAAVIYWVIRNRIRNIRRQSAIKQLMAETEMKALRAQMNPHFIFNCMATADGLILQNKKMEASDFLHKFSKLVRMVLENSLHGMVSLQKDVEALQLYLQLEQVRHQHMFSYTITIEKDVDENSTCIPPLLLQPFAENAILHGLRHRSDNDGQLQISIRREKDSLICKIGDNGIGRRKSALINKDKNTAHQSLGLKVTEARVKSMSLLYGEKQSVSLEDKANDSGTIVTITLPFFNNCF